MQEKSAYPVRQFITSGAADQPVPDYSTFRRSFVAAITGEAGIGKDGYLTGSQLGAYLEEKVTNYSRRTQTPQYGKLQDPNLDRGDFIFALPKGSTPMSPSAADAEIVFWQTIANSKNPDDFAAYLQQYPDGKFAALAALRAQPPAVEPASAPAAAAIVSPAEQARLAETKLALPPEQRQSVQRWLTALGHDTGGTDGQFGPQTRKAISAYQGAKAMPAT
ncbi:MAG: peptidoglycan-binding protein, partial [Alphaproteobacteria bacterium]|nr:peptidoglycan-binding protein [Alphaproteobacteria bacterium]